MSDQEQSARVASVRDGIDYSETIHHYLSTRPSLLLMNILLLEREQFSLQFPGLVSQLAAELTQLSLHCFTDDRLSLERVVTDRSVAILNFLQVSSPFFSHSVRNNELFQRNTF